MTYIYWYFISIPASCTLSGDVHAQNVSY